MFFSSLSSTLGQSNFLECARARCLYLSSSKVNNALLIFLCAPHLHFEASYSVITTARVMIDEIKIIHTHAYTYTMRVTAADLLPRAL
jgi:hypothetical protein